MERWILCFYLWLDFSLLMEIESQRLGLEVVSRRKKGSRREISAKG